jgi:hypothetical protein
MADSKKYDVNEFVVGDLVKFTGRLYSPDFVYIEQFDDKDEYGIVVGLGSGAYANILYRVYWFNHGRVVETVAGHMQLAYVVEKD